MEISIGLKEQTILVPQLPAMLSQFTLLCEEHFKRQLPDAYQIYQVTETEQLMLKDQTMYSVVVGLSKEQPIRLQLQECDLISDGAIMTHSLTVNRQDSLEQFTLSITDQKRRIDQLKQDLKYRQEFNEQSIWLPQQQVAPKPNPPQQDTLEQSVFNRDDRELRLNEIVDYYKKALNRFELNFLQQDQSFVVEKIDAFESTYKKICERMQIKLTRHFDELKRKKLEELNPIVEVNEHPAEQPNQHQIQPLQEEKVAQPEQDNLPKEEAQPEENNLPKEIIDQAPQPEGHNKEEEEQLQQVLEFDLMGKVHSLSEIFPEHQLDKLLSLVKQYPESTVDELCGRLMENVG